MSSLLSALQGMGLDQPKRNKAYKVGDIITYLNFANEKVRLKVEGKEEDIKNGRPGFDGQIVDGEEDDLNGVWGYDNQIIGVEPIQ